MLHHCGFLQPLQSSPQTFEDNFINFPIWDRRGNVRTDLKRQRGVLFCQTTQRKISRPACLTILMTKKCFRPLSERKICPPVWLIYPAAFDLEQFNQWTLTWTTLTEPEVSFSSSWAFCPEADFILKSLTSSWNYWLFRRQCEHVPEATFTSSYCWLTHTPSCPDLLLKALNLVLKSWTRHV